MSSKTSVYLRFVILCLFLSVHSSRGFSGEALQRFDQRSWRNTEEKGAIRNGIRENPSHRAVSSDTSTTNEQYSKSQASVEQFLPNVTPVQAKEAWMTHCWDEAGGLPLVVRKITDDTRTLFPPMLEEKLLQAEDDDAKDGSIELSYQMTSSGALTVVLSNDRSLPTGTVRFVPWSITTESGKRSNGCRVTWDVSFDARFHAQASRNVVQIMLNAAMNHLQGCVSAPRLLTRRMRLPGISAEQALQAWLDFVWEQGGGLFMPAFIVNVPEAQRRVIVPPGLSERVVSTDRDKHTIEYIVENPNIFTYAVYTHHGRVQFVQDDSNDESSVLLIWQVEIRPIRWLQWLTERFTDATVTTLTRNLAVHLLEPDVMVKVSPPRGKGESFAEVRKDSWLGGVLEAHLSDKRSTFEQTLAMLQPWTWGRSKDDDERLQASTEWTEARLSMKRYM
jgi:hypothetical protein